MKSLPEHVEAVMPGRRRDSRVEKVCPKCSASFLVYPSEASRRRFCSAACAGNAPANVTATCIGCAKQFATVPARIADGRARYCSTKCKHAGHAKRMTGARNPAHVDGKGRARKRLKTAARRTAAKAFEVSPKDLARLRDRQAGLCAHCTASLFDNGEHLDHVVPLYRGGAHSIGNLQLLCIECNLLKGKKTMAAFKAANGCPTEDVEQEMVMRWAEGQAEVWPELACLYHIANGGFRSKRTAVQMKRLGVKPGVPDLCLPIPRGGHNGLFIEMKRLKGGTVSPEQKAWLNGLNDNGYLAVVCRGHEEAINVLKDYLAADGAAANEED